MRILFAGLLLLPSLGAAVVRVLPMDRSAPARVTSADPLGFTQHFVHFRELKPARFVTARFRYFNRGDHPLRITKLDPSCGCLNPRLTDHELEPGEVGDLFLRVDMARQTGDVGDYSVTVHYADENAETAEPREHTLRVRVDFPAKRVVLQPRATALFWNGSQSATQTVHLIDYRGDALPVVNVSADSPLVSVETGTPEADVDGNWRTPILITAHGPPPDSLTPATVLVETADPDYGILEIPLRLGPIGDQAPVTAELPVNSPLPPPTEPTP